MWKDRAALWCVVSASLCAESWANGDPVGRAAVWMSGKWEVFDEDDPPGSPQPYPPKSDSWRRLDTTIMVSISSFRDYRCPKTLFNLFTKAVNPMRVYVGVVQQNNEGDPDCLYDYCKLMKDHMNLEPKVGDQDKPSKILANCPHADQVRMMRVQAEDAKGPTYGRYLQSKLLKEEEFCMQIDAHMDFEDHWDKRLMDMWGMTNNEYAVLTTYVPHFDQLHLNLNGRWEVPQVCKAFFQDPDRMVRNEQATNCIWLTKPKLTSSWAAGFAFSKCHAERRSPYDPHLPSVFDGEEYSKYARLWTRGYDTYTPHRSIVFHDYNHGPQTKSANAWARKHRELQRSHDRLKILLGMPDATVPRDSSQAKAVLGQWDLGTQRTLDQLIAFTGVDTRNYNVLFDSCGRKHFVPFEEPQHLDGHDAAVSESAPADAITGEELQLADEPPPVDGEALQLEGPEGNELGDEDAGRKLMGIGEADRGKSRDAVPGGRIHAKRGYLSGICLIAFFVLIWSCITMSTADTEHSMVQHDYKGVKIV